jgi:drug/metabolite transporter (DMT)-like permease
MRSGYIAYYLSFMPFIEIALLVASSPFWYLIISEVTRLKYRHIVAGWLSRKGYELLGFRPFIILWDDVVPPSYDVWV